MCFYNMPVSCILIFCIAVLEWLDDATRLLYLMCSRLQFSSIVHSAFVNDNGRLIDNTDLKVHSNQVRRSTWRRSSSSSGEKKKSELLLGNVGVSSSVRFNFLQRR